MKSLKLLHDVIHIAWEWIWDETDDTTEEKKSTKASTLDHVNPYIHSDSDPSGDEVEDGSPLIHPTHTVTFKCVGTTYDQKAQETLAIVSALLKKNEDVPVNIFPEPENQFDKKAICFKCLVGGEWRRIGYIVRESLDHVHAALSEKKNSKYKVQLGQVSCHMEQVRTRILCWH